MECVRWEEEGGHLKGLGEGTNGFDFCPYISPRANPVMES